MSAKKKIDRCVQSADEDEVVQLRNGKPLTLTRFYREMKAMQMDLLLSEIINDVSNDKPGSKRETREEKQTRIMTIFNALKEGKNDLKTFEFTNYTGFTQLSSVTIHFYLFKDERIVHGPELLYKGRLSAQRELGKNVAYAKFKNDDHLFDGAFLVAEVETNEPANPKLRGRATNGPLVKQTFYGVKSILRMDSDGDFDFDYGSTAIYTLNVDQEWVKKLNFNIGQPSTWMGKRKHFEALSKLAESIQVRECLTAGIPFIAFELSDESTPEDWEAVEKRLEIFKKFNCESNPGDKNLHYFVEKLPDGSLQKTFPFKSKFCPILCREFATVGDHITHLRWHFEFDFKLQQDENILVQNGTIEVTSVRSSFKPKQVEVGKPLSKIVWPIDYLEEPVPTLCGKSEWVRTGTQNKWKIEQNRRQLENDPTFPKGCIPFCMEINKFLTQNASKYYNENPGSVRQGYLDFFEAKFDMIVDEEKILEVLGITGHLMKYGIFSTSDYARTFDKFLEHRVAQRRKSEKASHQATSPLKSGIVIAKSKSHSTPQQEQGPSALSSPMSQDVTTRNGQPRNESPRRSPRKAQNSSLGLL